MWDFSSEYPHETSLAIGRARPVGRGRGPVTAQLRPSYGPVTPHFGNVYVLGLYVLGNPGLL